MPISNALLPSVLRAVQVDDLALDACALTATAMQAACPTCERLSAQVHGLGASVALDRSECQAGGCLHRQDVGEIPECFDPV